MEIDFQVSHAVFDIDHTPNHRITESQKRSQAPIWILYHPTKQVIKLFKNLNKPLIIIGLEEDIYYPDVHYDS